MEDLFKALGLFQQGVQEAAIAKGINDATTVVDQLRNNVEMDTQQKIAAQKQIANQLMAQLSAAGAPASRIQSAAAGLMPEMPQTSRDAFALAQQTGDPYYMKMAKDMQGFEGEPQEQQRSFLSQQNALDRALQRELAGLRAMGTMGEATAKAEQEKQKLAIPGFRLTNDAQAREADITKLRDGASALVTSLSAFDTVKKIVSNSDMPLSKSRQRAAAARTELLLQIKDMAQLGALAGPDVEVIEGMIPPVEGAKRLFSIDSNIVTRLTQAEEEMKRRVIIRMRSNGYEPTREMLLRMQIRPEQYNALVKGMNDADMDKQFSATSLTYEPKTVRNKNTGLFEVLLFDPNTGKPIGPAPKK